MAETLQAPRQSFDIWGEPTTPNYRVIQRSSSIFDEPTIYGYQDESGNVWSDLQRYGENGPNDPRVLLKSEAANNPYIQALGLVDTDLNKAQELYDLKQTNPSEFYKQVGSQLQNQIYEKYGQNANYDQAYQQLQSLKEVDPATYYENQLKFLGQQVGWQYGQGVSERAEPVKKQIEELAIEAQKAGLNPDQINSILNDSVNQAVQGAQQQRVNAAASSGGALAGLPQFAATVGAMFAAPALAGYLTPALGATLGGAATGATLGGATGGISAALGNGNIGQGILKGGLLGGAGGAVAGGISDFFSVPTVSEDAIAAYANSTPDPILTMSELKSMSPSDLAATLGVQGASNFGTQLASKLGSKLATTGLASLLSGEGGATARASGANSGTDLTSLANALKGSSFTPMNVAQIQYKNPFLFETPGQTEASEGVYDVSGTNPMANALRKRNYGIG